MDSNEIETMMSKLGLGAMIEASNEFTSEEIAAASLLVMHQSGGIRAAKHT